MKKITLGVVALLMTIGTVVFAKDSAPKKQSSSCCHSGSACCYPGTPCCDNK